MRGPRRKRARTRLPPARAGAPWRRLRGAWTTALIISRYLLRELSRPLAVILGILVALFASYTAAGFLANAVDGLLPPSLIAELIALKVLIALEVLIPASLYVSVLLSLARLHGDSEFAAMFAIRVTPATLIRAVLVISGGLAILVACLSLVVRPFAYQKLHALSDHAATLLDIDAMEAGSFYVSQGGDRVIFLGHRAAPGATARDVFIRLRRPDGTQIVHARLADRMLQQALAGHTDVFLTDARIYKIDRGPDRPDEVVEAQGLVIDPNDRADTPPGHSAVAASSAILARSASPEDVAELQWRLSTPLSTLLLGLLGIPLSRTRPRHHRNSRLGVAMLVYFGYYLLCTSARTWVQHGVVGPLPGIWWAPALLALFIIVATWWPGLALRRQGRTKRPGTLPLDPVKGSHP